MSVLKDLRGKVFERLTVIGRNVNDKNGRARWDCECSCGKKSTVISSELISGGTKSCGCLGTERRVLSVTTHGLSGTSEHNIWFGMKDRCNNPRSKAFKDYGGRGIKISDEWDSFEKFLMDMGARPGKNFSVERIDNDKGYSKSNCKWATQSEQAFNRRKKKTNTTGVTGVHPHNNKKGYVARISIGKKDVYLGYFTSLFDAICARKSAELR